MRLLTWRLWLALRHPEADQPLFQRVQRQPIDLPGKRLLRPVYTHPVFKFLWGIISALLPVVVVIIAPLALLLASNVIGALLAFNVMGTINREREQGTYDLLALTPNGLGASNWLIAAAWTQRLTAIDRLATFRTLTIIILSIVLLSTLGSERLSPITVLALLVALNLDAIQTLITGCLSGMLAQQFEGSGSPFGALGIFAFAQVIAIYLPATAAIIFLSEVLYLQGWEYSIIQSVVAVVGVLLLFALHEIVIRWMWRSLERRLL